jgi:DNA recombination protein RmuC
MASHWNNIGKHLGQSVEAYNDATASLSSRVLVTARKLKDLDAAHGSDELPAAKPVAQTVSNRRLERPEELSLENLPPAK